MTRYQILSALTLLVLSHAAVGLEQTDRIRSQAAAAHADGRTFDTATGDDVRHFPPDPQVDFRHIQLDMRFDDPMTKSFACTETITFRTRELPLPRLTLDAVDVDIQRISDLAGSALTFRYDGERLTIRFAEALAASTDGGVRIEYTCRDPKDGMFFVLPDDAYPDRPLQVHTQGQTESNRHWFICHDH
ncbi:MAG: hypothetical protein JXA69_20225, partial [Phycisphaerae bacterium]|nr:hypothetical protein [Phycisphaerae bacterium]